MSSEKKLKDSGINLNKRLKAIRFFLPKIWDELLSELKKCDSMDCSDWMQLVQDVFSRNGRKEALDACGFDSGIWIEFIGDIESYNGRIWYKDFRSCVIDLNNRLSFNLELFDTLKELATGGGFFKVGNLVKLKSHPGLHMTIDSFGHKGVCCVWFNKNGEFSREYFNPFCLDLVD